MAYTTINKGSSYFNTVTYTGTGVARDQTGVGFNPDWVWIKCRSNATTDNVLFDRVRTAGQRLVSNDTGAEETQTGIMSAFVTDGVTLGAGAASNGSGRTYVMWNWLANNTAGSSNTDGSRTSTVAANTTAGFSIVGYTGNSTVGTVGHGLGVAPRMMIIKDRTSGAYNWTVYHASIGNTRRIILNSTAGQDSANSVWWNNTSPTSTVFTIGTDNGANANGDSFIAYCFAEVKGYSKFNSYTGNGSTDGTFVYTGFKPAFIMTKRTDTTSAWWIYDNKRNPYNDPALYLNANTSNAEIGLTSVLDSCSNGFKMRNTYTDLNASGGTYIYMAFAENPFVSSTQIPTTAR